MCLYCVLYWKICLVKMAHFSILQSLDLLKLPFKINNFQFKSQKCPLKSQKHPHKSQKWPYKLKKYPKINAKCAVQKLKYTLMNQTWSFPDSSTLPPFKPFRNSGICNNCTHSTGLILYAQFLQTKNLHEIKCFCIVHQSWSLFESRINKTLS